MKYLTKADILILRSLETEDFKFNHSLADDYVAKLSPDVRLPITSQSYERVDGPYKTIVRLIIIIPTDGKTDKDTTSATVDMPIPDYLALPEMDRPAAI